MGFELYINDVQIELTNSNAIGYTISVGSIFDLNSRSGSYTNKFTAPRTQKNNEALGHLANINSDTNKPYIKNRAKLIQNGVEIVSDGFAVIDQAGANYKLSVHSGNSSFFDLIGDNALSSIDWKDTEHVFDVDNIIDSFLPESKYTYAIIDWSSTGLMENSSFVNSELLVPCLYLSTIFDKIGQSIDYEIKGNFIESDQYKRHLVTPDKSGINLIDIEENTGFTGSDTSITQTRFVPAGTGMDVRFVQLAYNNPSIDSFTGNIYSPPKHLFGELSFTFNIGWVCSSINGTLLDHSLTANIKDSTGKTLATFNRFEEIVQAFSFDFNETISTGNIILDPSLNYFVEIVISHERHPSIDYETRYTLASSSFNVNISRDISYGATVDMSMFYDESQKNIIKDVVNMYCLLIQTNDLTRQIHFNYMNDLSGNLTISEDWSDKIDTSRIPTITYRASSYGQTSNLKYASDEVVPDGFGDGSFEVKDENLDKIKDVIQLFSAAAEAKNLVGNKNVPNIPFREVVGESFEKKKNRFLLRGDSDGTIVLTNPLNNNTSLVNSNGNIPFCYFSKEDRQDSLDFTTLIQNNYSTIRGMLDKPKFVSAYFMLKEIDVNNIDFSIPVFLDVHTSDFSINGYFFINKINNFKDDSSIKVDLIRL